MRTHARPAPVAAVLPAEARDKPCFAHLTSTTPASAVGDGHAGGARRTAAGRLPQCALRAAAAVHGPRRPHALPRLWRCHGLWLLPGTVSRACALVSTLTLYPAIEVQPWRQNAVTSLVVTAHLNFYITPAAALCSQPVDWRSALQCLPDRLAACLVATSHSNPTLAANRLAPPLPQVGQTNIEKRVLKAEKTAARRALVPVLQAEEDRRCAFDISHCGKSFIYCNPKT